MSFTEGLGTSKSDQSRWIEFHSWEGARTALPAQRGDVVQLPLAIHGESGACVGARGSGRGGDGCVDRRAGREKGRINDLEELPGATHCVLGCSPINKQQQPRGISQTSRGGGWQMGGKNDNNGLERFCRLVVSAS